jgi:hypothetical protein
MEYDNVGEMYCTSGYTVENPLKVLHQYPLLNVDVDDIEGDKKIGGNIAYITCYEDCYYGYDVGSCDDHDVKNDGLKCSYEKLQDARVAKNKKILVPIDVIAKTLSILFYLPTL